MSFKWNGRQITKTKLDSDTTITYKYDSDGLRTQKVVNGVQYDYYYVAGQLRYEKKGSEYELVYRYNNDGTLASITRYRFSDSSTTTLYAVTNTRGDVIKLLNDTGTVNSIYTYDSWGKLISVTSSTGAARADNTMAIQSSIRYRGYVYDTETGLYYLQSRYYDPETGRFLNADDVDFIGASGTVLSYNAFAYCENNVMNKKDLIGRNVQNAIVFLFVVSAMYNSLEIFLDEYMNIRKYNIKKFQYNENDFYKARVEYEDFKNNNSEKLKKYTISIDFGDCDIWAYRSANMNHFENALIESAGDMLESSERIEDYNPNAGDVASVIPWASSLILIVSSLVKYGKRTSVEKKVYNYVWGSNGLDPQNVHSYMVFKISDAKDKYKDKNGYHAFSFQNGDKKEITV